MVARRVALTGESWEVAQTHIAASLRDIARGLAALTTTGGLDLAESMH